MFLSLSFLAPPSSISLFFKRILQRYAMNYHMIKMTWLCENRPRDWGPFFVVLAQRGRTGHYLVFLLGLFPFDKKFWGSRGCRIDTFFDVHRSRNVHSWFRLVPEPVLLSHRKRLSMSIVTRGVVSRKKNKGKIMFTNDAQTRGPGGGTRTTKKKFRGTQIRGVEKKC